MKKLLVSRTLCAAGLAAACVFGLAGCSSDGLKLTGGTAATVNGVGIDEDDVTRTVESVRESLGVTDEDSWGAWMSENGYTPESVREEVLDGFIEQEILRQGAEEMGLSVDQSEVDSYYDQMAAQFASEEKWQAALASAGYASEDEYREAIELSLLVEAVQESLSSDQEPSDDDMLSSAQANLDLYDGAKRSSHILFDAGDEATAQEVLDQINSGELDFAAAAEQYSEDSGSAVNGGDVGWDALTSFVDEYQTGLDELSLGEVSGLVTSDYGIHIIKCTDVFVAPSTLTSVDQLPTEFVDAVRTELQADMQSEAYDNWRTEQREAAEIVINDIPTNVSYYVDMAKYDSDDADSTEGETDDAVDGEDLSVEEANGESVDGEATDEEADGEADEKASTE